MNGPPLVWNVIRNSLQSIQRAGDIVSRVSHMRSFPRIREGDYIVARPEQKRKSFDNLMNPFNNYNFFELCSVFQIR